MTVLTQPLTGALKRVLFHYHLHLVDFTQIGHVFKVKCLEGIYALKKIKTDERAKRLLYMRRKFNALPLRTVPILHSMEGDLVVKEEGNYYYLTPWIDEVPFSDEKKVGYFVDCLAYLHHSTVEMEPVDDTEKVVRCVEAIKAKWRSYEEWLTAFVYRAEHTIYPSPFEQLVLAHYNAIIQKTEQAIGAIDKWKEVAVESPMQRLVLCHGQPSIDHFICDNRGAQLLNLEAATMDTPCLDIAAFIDSLSHSSVDLVKLLNIYEMSFPLRDNEKDLLVAFLHFPAAGYRTILDYHHRREQGRELETIRAFERVHHVQPKREELIQVLHKSNDEKDSAQD